MSGAVRGRHRTVTTWRDPGAARQLDLVKPGWDVVNPDTVWVADFTYVWTYQGFCYVSFITDVASRPILGWKASMSKEAPLVTDALQQTLATRRRLDSGFTTTGLVHHSDAGSQYISIALSEQLREAGIAGSIGTVGDVLIESTIGLFKTELIEAVKAPSWSSRQHVETTTAAWVDWFNCRRCTRPLGTRRT